MKTTYTVVLASAAVATVIGLVGCNDGDTFVPTFGFSTATKDRFVRVDRTGQPAIATALL